jgi:hypothetical protein
LQIAAQKARKKAAHGFVDNARKGVDHNSTGAALEQNLGSLFLKEEKLCCYRNESSNETSFAGLG